MARFLAHALLLGLGGLACGGGEGAPDAGLVDGGADAAPDGGASSCMPAATIDSPPDQLPGTLAGASSGLDIAEDACAVVDAPFGVAAAGPDQVITLTGLIASTDYAVRLISGGDLAFYVGTGCATDETVGATVSGCMLFVDASTRSREVGRFTAPGNGEAVVVVDHYRVEAPVDGSYTLEVYPVECDEDDASACSGATSECVDFRCVACADSFDCTSPTAPVCDAIENTCVAGGDECVGDDASENGDDGPAGATDITPVGTTSTTNASICNAPLDEFDYFRFSVAQPGEHYTIDVSWPNPAIDIDVQVTDQDGVPFGLSLYEHPETIVLTYLPAGTYYVRLNYFAQGEITTVAPYTITATRTTGQTCASSLDCAAEYRNQLFRSVCTAGACEYRIGTGSLDEGATCDSDADCTSATCAAFPFTAEANSRSVCTRECSTDLDCASLGADYVCTDYLSVNECVQKCTDDQQCPTVIGAQPSAGPWFRLACALATGKCTF